MNKRKLGNTGIEVSEIGCGGIPFQRVSKEEMPKLIDALIENGINFIDTARGYTCSEDLLGEVIKEKRDKFFLASKGMARTYKGLAREIQISLVSLNIEYIDLYQLHNVSVGENIEGALIALKQAQELGLVKHIGVTTHSVEFLKQAIEMDCFETIQFPYNIIENQGEKLLKEAYNKGKGIIIMKPFAGGAIENKKLALKYLLNNKYISVVIPGMESVEQIVENSSVVSGPLTKEEIEELINTKEKFKNDFCRRCGYCMPCTAGINIPLAFLCEGYYTRYNLKEWAQQRYDEMKVKASACISCKKCESLCPYHLNISQKMKNVADIFERNE